ncbi:hypothetical protein OG978_34625 [Streptomyces sp. NBC_01591]|uniref:hypothetical protein n=1 Tax=Streptomyces sp. NBC_01591 TaxID=2975888 RepID=UPI002DD8C9B3|nr:hypothetical protein [Streptomyces sp. NBC_01591]WSD72084.1 hypothetical protein OG978_34625 [Streptomyces sp. NBC_01591]
MLTRYHDALYQIRLGFSAMTIAGAERALQQWDAISDGLADAQLSAPSSAR